MKKLKCIDLFCGAGGSTTGVTDTGLVDVIACINHDNIAIRSHEANHPNCIHHTEDIRLFDEKILPKCDLLTISAECTQRTSTIQSLPTCLMCIMLMF
jgi:site-specific DNA-cytosine methylase